MSLEALIFDVDGTLADTEEVHRLAFNDAFREHGVKWEWDRSLYMELLQTTGGKERIAHYIASLDLPAVEAQRLRWQIPRIHETKTRLYTQRIEGGAVALRPGVERLIAEAWAAGLKVAIATTTTLANIRALIVSGLGFHALARFDVIAGSDAVAEKKPAPDVYLYALWRLRLAPEQCVAIEDSRAGLRSAKAARLNVVITPTRWTENERFADADLVLPSLGDASAPFDAATAQRMGERWLSLPLLDAMHACWQAHPAGVDSSRG